MNQVQHQPRVVEHPPLLCAHCGEAQTKSLILAQPPTPTVCMHCDGAVILRGPLWLEQLSELHPEAHGLTVIRLALQQSIRSPRLARKLS